MGCSTLHIKTEVECRVFLFDEEKGIATPGSYFNLEVRKGEQDLQFVSTYDEFVCCQMRYNVEENDREYCIIIEKSWFKIISLDEMNLLAEKGNIRTQYKLGVWYWTFEHNYNEAAKWIRKAAEQGDPDAQHIWGIFLYKGYGVEQNYVEAVNWYRKAAEQGNDIAQNKLGECYYYGNGVEKDVIEAVKWYRMAAEQGCADAQYNLSDCYNYGQGVIKDDVEATKWLRNAAEQGHVVAQRDLGARYADGEGVEKDFFEAVKWFREAAEQRDPIAQYFLGWCYAEGNGVEKDYTNALKWYRSSAKQGNNFAKEKLKKLEIDLDNSISPYYLFFDTETTGVPIDYNAPASDTRNWPRLVQLGWILTNKNGDILNQGNEIVYPNGFVIPDSAANVHGITTEKARQIGKPLRDVITAFLNDVKQSRYLVGHNISFDQRVVGAELYRLGETDIVSNMQSICTMKTTVDFCKIPGRYGCKYPQLQELYTKLFGCKFEDAHDAMADITATKKCFFELKQIGVIQNEKEQTD